MDLHPDPTAARLIVSVVSVTDTRTYEEQGERWVPIPGSGQEHECSRCGRMHEVHAIVRLDDGTEELVGTGCAARAAIILGPRLRSAEAHAKRVAALTAEVARLTARMAEYRAVEAGVAAMPTPPVTLAPAKAYESGVMEFRCGAEGWALWRPAQESLDMPAHRVAERNREREAERRRTAILGWRRARVTEQLVARWKCAPHQTQDVALRLATAQKKLARLLTSGARKITKMEACDVR